MKFRILFCVQPIIYLSTKGSSPAESSEIKKGPGAREVELMTSMFQVSDISLFLKRINCFLLIPIYLFQNLFPSINVTKVKINSIRRCVLLNYDAEKDTVELRHYTIKVVVCNVLGLASFNSFVKNHFEGCSRGPEQGREKTGAGQGAEPGPVRRRRRVLVEGRQPLRVGGGGRQ